MVQRLCFDERTRIEAMREAQMSVAVIAERLGCGRVECVAGTGLARDH